MNVKIDNETMIDPWNGSLTRLGTIRFVFWRISARKKPPNADKGMNKVISTERLLMKFKLGMPKAEKLEVINRNPIQSARQSQNLRFEMIAHIKPKPPNTRTALPWAAVISGQ